MSEPTYSKGAKYVHANKSSLLDGKEIEQRGNSFGEEKNFSTPSVRGVGGSTVIDLTDDGLGGRQLAHNLTMSRFFKYF